jgi:hypothetical protein
MRCGAALKEGSVVLPFRRLNLRNLLVLAQVAGSVALLLLTGVPVLGYQTTLGVSVGLNPNNLYLMALDPVRVGRSSNQAKIFFTNLLDRVQRLPSITASCLTDSVPLTVNSSTSVVFQLTEKGGAFACYW